MCNIMRRDSISFRRVRYYVCFECQLNFKHTRSGNMIEDGTQYSFTQELPPEKYGWTIYKVHKKEEHKK